VGYADYSMSMFMLVLFGIILLYICPKGCYQSSNCTVRHVTNGSDCATIGEAMRCDKGFVTYM